MIGLEKRKSRKTRITFMTTGVFLQILANNQLVEKISHVILDEVHERDVDSDFSMIALKHLLASYYQHTNN